MEESTLQEKPPLLTVEDQYHNIMEEAKTALDDSSMAALHQLIDRVVSRVNGLYGSDSRQHATQKVVKVLFGAIESRVTRQLRAEGEPVRRHVRKRRVLDWRNL